MEVSERQSIVLRKVIEGHVALGQPVGSKWLAEQPDLPWGPSTIRAELAMLEELGLLQHPHTSAGRVPHHPPPPAGRAPPDQGSRHYVDELLEQGLQPVPRPRVQLSDMRREIDDAMRSTTEQLSQ